MVNNYSPFTVFFLVSLRFEVERHLERELRCWRSRPYGVTERIGDAIRPRPRRYGEFRLASGRLRQNLVLARDGFVRSEFGHHADVAPAPAVVGEVDASLLLVGPPEQELSPATDGIGEQHPERRDGAGGRLPGGRTRVRECELQHAGVLVGHRRIDYRGVELDCGRRVGIETVEREPDVSGRVSAGEPSEEIDLLQRIGQAFGEVVRLPLPLHDGGPDCVANRGVVEVRDVRHDLFFAGSGFLSFDPVLRVDLRRFEDVLDGGPVGLSRN